jgi:hypothetical protein
VSRTFDVAPDRLVRWVDSFNVRHGGASVAVDGGRVRLTAADGSTAVLDPPFAALLPALADAADADADAGAVAAIAAHAVAPRLVGVILVRLGGFAAGVFDGTTLVASKVGSRPVHARAAAGGWSQHRFARRREGQAKVALAAAADAAVAVVAAAPRQVDVVVTGGDRQALRTVLADPRLAFIGSRVDARVLDVPDPRAGVLRDSLALARAVRVTVHDVLTG